MSIEQEKVDAESGLSRAWQKALGITFTLLIIGAGYYFFAGGNDGGFRSCIKSSFGSLPDCSDTHGGDGVPKRTMVNGKDIGICSNVTVNGDCVK